MVCHVILRLIVALMVIFLSLVASVLRHIYIRPGVGVGALQKVYGGVLAIIQTFHYAIPPPPPPTPKTKHK